MRITRIKISNYRSIRLLDTVVPPGGLLAVGPNRTGKTNLLRAIRAICQGRGIGLDAIREGADGSEIEIETDDERLHTVKQTISEKSSNLTIRTSKGDKVTKPREQLQEVLGLPCFDALAFYLAEPKDQRRMVIETVNEHAALVPEDVKRWTGEDAPEWIGQFPNGFDALVALTKAYKDRRKEAKRLAEEAAVLFREAEEKVRRVESPAHAGVEVPDEEGAEEIEADAARDSYRKISDRLPVIQQNQVKAIVAKDKVKAAREEAKEIRARPEYKTPTKDEIDEAGRALSDALAELKKAQQKHEQAAAAVMGLEKRAHVARQLQEKVIGICKAASEIEATIADLEAQPITLADLDRAKLELDEATAKAKLIKSARKEKEARASAQTIGVHLDEVVQEAHRMDGIVKLLASTAQAELCARAAMIPGVTLTEDAVLYNGRPIRDGMSGSEQMILAVKIAKSLSPGAGLLVVDEIGVLDDESMRAFVDACQEGDWQLIASRMENLWDADGKPTRHMVLEAIEGEQAGVVHGKTVAVVGPDGHQVET